MNKGKEINRLINLTRSDNKLKHDEKANNQATEASLRWRAGIVHKQTQRSTQSIVCRNAL